MLGLAMKFAGMEACVLDLTYVTCADKGYDPLLARDCCSAATSVFS